MKPNLASRLLRRLRPLLAALLLTIPAAGAGAGTSLVPAYGDLPPRGPQAAPGVVIYSHGRALHSEDSLSPSPAYLRDLAVAGWDTMRFNRPSAGDTLTASAADLALRVKGLKAAGYAHVVLAGQSFGAFLSIMAAAEEPGVDAVIATAPAAFGSFYDSYDSWQLNASELYRHLAQLRGTRVLLAFFHGDDYDPGGRAVAAESILSSHGVPHLILDQPRGLAGHLAAASRPFADRYAGCLEEFLADTALSGAASCESLQAMGATAGLAPTLVRGSGGF
jgi:pimeloyl-ACP methyl ester carboxylesterase